MSDGLVAMLKMDVVKWFPRSRKPAIVLDCIDDALCEERDGRDEDFDDNTYAPTS